MKITWNKILLGEIPDYSGVYAWYYVHEIGRQDIAKLIYDLSSLDQNSERIILIEKFLSNKIFSHYKEQPYTASIEGQLKLKYKGKIYPQDSISSSLIEKISTNPDSLYMLADLLKNISPNFMRPLYIGMADSLSQRIIVHKNNIEKYKRISDEYFHYEDNFAARVVKRKFRLKNLYVTIQRTPKEGVNNSLENILNRINYPVLGRN